MGTDKFDPTLIDWVTILAKSSSPVACLVLAFMADSLGFTLKESRKKVSLYRLLQQANKDGFTNDYIPDQLINSYGLPFLYFSSNQGPFDKVVLDHLKDSNKVHFGNIVYLPNLFCREDERIIPFYVAEGVSTATADDDDLCIRLVPFFCLEINALAEEEPLPTTVLAFRTSPSPHHVQRVFDMSVKL